jgi:hypothetical protein
MEADVRQAFDTLERAFTTLERVIVDGFYRVERRIDSLDRRLEALERESVHTTVLFGQFGESLANLDEQVGRNNARLDRMTALLMASKTEATARHGQMEKRLLALEERLPWPANDPRGSDA